MFLQEEKTLPPISPRFLTPFLSTHFAYTLGQKNFLGSWKCFFFFGGKLEQEYREQLTIRRKNHRTFC